MAVSHTTAVRARVSVHAGPISLRGRGSHGTQVLVSTHARCFCLLTHQSICARCSLPPYDSAHLRTGGGCGGPTFASHGIPTPTGASPSSSSTRPPLQRQASSALDCCMLLLTSCILLSDTASRSSSCCMCCCRCYCRCMCCCRCYCRCRHCCRCCRHCCCRRHCSCCCRRCCRFSDIHPLPPAVCAECGRPTLALNAA